MPVCVCVCVCVCLCVCVRARVINTQCTLEAYAEGEQKHDVLRERGITRQKARAAAEASERRRDVEV